MNVSADAAGSGLALLEAEMARQHRDALDSIRSNAEMAGRVGASIMRDRRLLSATLERVCDPDAFYLGASVERNADGRLCSGRDTLRSRTGANCQISRINRLVAVKD